MTSGLVRSVSLAAIAALTLGSLLEGGPALASPATVPEADGGPSVARLLERRITDPRLGRDVAMIVLDARTGAVVYGHEPDRLMHTASNMKIVTAITAVATMGPDTRFATTVRRGATRRDVVLQGAGDPLLTSAELQRLAVRTARALPHRGRVVVHVDGDLFPPPNRGPGWTEHYVSYVVASVQALARRGDHSKHPARNAAGVFVARLRSLGISARLGGNRDANADAPVLARAHGHTVRQAVAVMLRESESNVAEVLFRQTALASGRHPTWTGARLAAEDAVRSLGVSPEGMLLYDGSGLSRKDRLSPRFLASLLRVARIVQPRRFAAVFRPRAMPVAGRTGTLTTAYGRYSTSPSRCARGLVQAKTGTLFDTIALSGIARRVTGGRRVFSILVNSRPQQYSPLSTRRAVDGLAATVTGCWD